MIHWPSVRTLALVFVAATALSCGGDSGTAPDGGGTLVIQMHDMPFNDAQAVFVTFADVSVRRDSGNMEKLDFDGGGTRTCDLKKLEDGHSELLASASPPEGHYNQIRIAIGSAHLYWENKTNPPACQPRHSAPGGRDREVSIPDAERVVTLDREFDVQKNTRTTITLDFDGEKSIMQGGASGQFILHPLIRVDAIDGP